MSKGGLNKGGSPITDTLIEMGYGSPDTVLDLSRTPDHEIRSRLLDAFDRGQRLIVQIDGKAAQFVAPILDINKVHMADEKAQEELTFEIANEG